MVFMKNEKYNIYCFNECHITPEITEQELQVDGYYFLRCDSLSRHTGGIIMYVAKSIQANIICNKNIDNKIWFLGIKYRDFNKKVINIIGVYRSPSCSVS